MAIIQARNLRSPPISLLVSHLPPLTSASITTRPLPPLTAAALVWTGALGWPLGRLLRIRDLLALSPEPEPATAIFLKCKSCLVTPQRLQIAYTIKPKLLSIEIETLHDPDLGSLINLITLCIRLFAAVEPAKRDLQTDVLKMILAFS